MHAYLVTGKTKEARLNRINLLIHDIGTTEFDRIEIPQETARTGINEVRSFIGRIQLKPATSEYSCGIIYGAHRMTPEAQNALLKTLEEPPIHAVIILEAENTEMLLSTVLSRVHILHSDIGKKTADTASIPSVLSQTGIAERLLGISKSVRTKEDAMIVLDGILRYIHMQLSEGRVSESTIYPNEMLPIIGRKVLRSKAMLEANVWFTACVDSIFL